MSSLFHGGSAPARATVSDALVFRQDQRRPHQVVVMQPRQDSRSESIAGADRVHNVDAGSRDSQPEVAMGTKRAVGAERDHHQDHALGKEIVGGGGVVTVWIEPGQVPHDVCRVRDREAPGSNHRPPTKS